MELPEELKAALDEKVYVHLATVMPDGSPQVSVVWIGRDGDKVLFSTAEGRVKTSNIRADNRVALSFTPQDDSYNNFVMRGRVTRFEADGFWLIDALAKKYTGSETYEGATPGQIRVNGEIEIDTLSVHT
ncbi:MAG: PPOX class F420-dependent oxidoreductase [Acidimicrobiia bacterium]